MSSAREAVWFIAVLAAACGVESRVAAFQPQPSTESRLQIELHRSGSGHPIFEVRGLQPRELSSLATAQFTSSQWSALFAVFVNNHRAVARGNLPPMLGAYETVGGVVRFTPRFPLQPGLRYLAVFDPSRLPGNAELRPSVIEKEFFLNKPRSVATTVVEQVYPSRNTLPGNLLKFYLHFSAPMQRGEAYRYLRLLDASQREIDLPFLELDEELWDPEGKRFTLFFDPGRIKRGNRPREEVGPVLEQGKSYTLVIDRHWLDGAGNPLKESYRKSFTVGPPDDTQPGTENYRISPPPAGSQKALILSFPESLDHAMLQRVITVTDAHGNRLRGRVSVEAQETQWRFIPATPWKQGRYQIVLDTILEDLAGNSIGRPFEVDLFHPIERRVVSKTVALPFVIE